MKAQTVKRHLVSLLILALTVVSPVAATTLTATPTQKMVKEATSSMSKGTEADVSSYELFYPIVAGMVQGDFWYFLKNFREGFAEKVTFGEVKKSEYHLVLSKKRLVEAEKLLLVKKDQKKAEQSLQGSVDEIKLSLELAQTAQSKGKRVRDLYNMISQDASKEVLFLGIMKNRVSQDAQPALQKTQETVGSVIAQIQTIKVDQ